MSIALGIFPVDSKRSSRRDMQRKACEQSEVRSVEGVLASWFSHSPSASSTGNGLNGSRRSISNRLLGVRGKSV